MRTIQVSDEVKEIVERHVAAGSAPSDGDFIEEAVRRYADYLEDDEDELIAAAQEGLEAIRRGDYTTISNPADAAAFFETIWAESRKIVAELRASHNVDATATTATGTDSE